MSHNLNEPLSLTQGVFSSWGAKLSLDCIVDKVTPPKNLPALDQRPDLTPNLRKGTKE